MRTVVLLLICLLTGSCSTAPRVQFTDDPYTNTKHWQSSFYPALDGRGLLSSTDIFLTANKLIYDENNPPIYYLQIDVLSDSWVFISRGNSLKFFVDGEKMELSSQRGSNGHRDVLYGGRVKESVKYYANTEKIEKLANAEKVELRIYGKKGYIEREFGNKTFQNLRAFVADAIKGETTASLYQQ